MPRIWLLSEFYFPEQISTGYLLTKTAEGLAEEYEVKVIAGPATNFFVACENFPNSEVRNGVEIFRCRGTSFDKNLIYGRFLNLVTRSAAIFWKALLLCQRGEMILVVTNPPLLPFVALLLKWLKGCQFVLLIHDVYPEILVATGICQNSSVIVRLGQMMNRVLYRQSCRIITLGRDMSSLVKAKLSENDAKIICIPNWADGDIVTPTDRDKNTVLQTLGLTDRFVVLYVGNIGRTHGIEYILEAAKKIQHNKKISFVIRGFGAKRKWLEEQVTAQKLENLTLLSTYDSSEKRDVLNACDVAIVSFIPGMAGVSVPSRMYNQMAAGKPIIAVTDDWSELALVVCEEEIGWVVEPGDIAGLVRTVELAAEHPELCEKKGSKAAVVAQTKYTFQKADRAYKNLFRELFGPELT